MDSKTTVLLYGDVPNAPTGYGQTLHHLGYHLQKAGYRVVFSGVGFTGNPIPYVYKDKNDEVIGEAELWQGADFHSVTRCLMEIRPDLFIALRDAWIYCNRPWGPGDFSFKSVTDQTDTKSIIYTPTQAHPLPVPYLDCLKNKFDIAWTMTNWSRRACINQGMPEEKIRTLWHGFDPELYYPRNIDRKKLGINIDGKVIGYVGMNLGYRKAFPLLMMAMKHLLTKRGDVYLYMHTEQRGQGYILDNHNISLGLKGRIMFPAGHDRNWALPERAFAQLLHTFDVYATPAYSEGFGIPPLQAAASGLPIVATDFPNHREVLGKGAIYVKTTQDYPTNWGYEWRVDTQDMAEKLHSVLNWTEDEKTKFQKRQSKIVEKFKWDNIGKTAVQLIEEALS